MGSARMYDSLSHTITLHCSHSFPPYRSLSRQKSQHKKRQFFITLKTTTSLFPPPSSFNPFLLQYSPRFLPPLASEAHLGPQYFPVGILHHPFPPRAPSLRHLVVLCLIPLRRCSSQGDHEARMRSQREGIG